MVARRHKHPDPRLLQRAELFRQSLVTHHSPVEGEISRQQQGIRHFFGREQLFDKGIQNLFRIRHKLAVTGSKHALIIQSAVCQAGCDIMRVASHRDPVIRRRGAGEKAQQQGQRQPAKQLQALHPFSPPSFPSSRSSHSKVSSGPGMSGVSVGASSVWIFRLP